MAKKIRNIIKIDEELCNGCGLCVPSCAEGAIALIDGKAKLVAEKYCDGLGACLGECPTGALTIEQREVDDFDEKAAMEHVERRKKEMNNHNYSKDESKACGCPSAKTIDRRNEQIDTDTSASLGNIASALRQWPVKLRLVNPTASYFNDSDLLVAADCVPFAYGNIHQDFMKGKSLVTGCPKFDDYDSYVEKLTEILTKNDIKSVYVMVMEVPCCTGLRVLTETAIKNSGKQIPLLVVTIGLEGQIKELRPVVV
ncbi:MAG: 4Fe-4S binding protein [Armatimonadota bacterium]